MEQRSDEWFAARIGKLTASRIADATARTKTGWGASRKNYMAELLVERLTGQPAPRYTNAAMEWGTKYEAEACAVYEFESHYEDIKEVGFVPHPRIPMSGASPDRLVGADKLLEVKCPDTATHIETFLGGAIDDKYIKQMQWQLACTSRKCCDFMSYDPRLPLEYRIAIQTVFRDDKLIAKLEKEAEEFLAELDAKHKALIEIAHGHRGDALRELLEASVAKETAT